MMEFFFLGILGVKNSLLFHVDYLQWFQIHQCLSRVSERYEASLYSSVSGQVKCRTNEVEMERGIQTLLLSNPLRAHLSLPLFILHSST